MRMKKNSPPWSVRARWSADLDTPGMVRARELARSMQGIAARLSVQLMDLDDVVCKIADQTTAPFTSEDWAKASRRALALQGSVNELIELHASLMPLDALYQRAPTRAQREREVDAEGASS
jgi:hypothetical protein